MCKKEEHREYSFIWRFIFNIEFCINMIFIILNACCRYCPFFRILNSSVCVCVSDVKHCVCVCVNDVCFRFLFHYQKKIVKGAKCYNSFHTIDHHHLHQPNISQPNTHTHTHPLQDNKPRWKKTRELYLLFCCSLFTFNQTTIRSTDHPNEKKTPNSNKKPIRKKNEDEEDDDNEKFGQFIDDDDDLTLFIHSFNSNKSDQPFIRSSRSDSIQRSLWWWWWLNPI